jgi:hypothetical protein
LPTSGVVPPGATTQIAALIQFAALPPQTHEGLLTFLYGNTDETVPIYVNRKPEITAPSRVKYVANSPLEIQLVVLDPDLDGVTLSATPLFPPQTRGDRGGLPDGAALTETQLAPGQETPMTTSLRWERPTIGDYAVALSAIDSLGAAVEHTIELEIVSTLQWTIELKPNQPNFIHIPVFDSRFPSVGRLFDFLRPRVEQILTYDSSDAVFRAYTALSTPGMSDDLPLEPHTGVIVVLKPGGESQRIVFEGVPYTQQPSISIPIRSGTNLIGLPINDPRFETFNDLKAYYPHITEIIGQDDTGRLTSAAAADPSLDGGRAIIVLAAANFQLELSGGVWIQKEAE